MYPINIYYNDMNVKADASQSIKRKVNVDIEWELDVLNKSMHKFSYKYSIHQNLRQ